MENKNDKLFAITSLTRADLLSQGFKQEDIDKIDDQDMQDIADKMGEAYMQYYWDDLNSLMEDRGFNRTDNPL